MQAKAMKHKFETEIIWAPYTIEQRLRYIL